MNSKSDLLHAILDSMGEGLFTVDKNFKITSFNRAAEDITKIYRESAVNKFCKYILHSDKCAKGCPLALTLEKEHNIYDYTMTIEDRFSNPIKVKVNTAILLDNQKQPVGGIVSFRECKPCYFMEDDLEKKTRFDGMIGVSKTMQEVFELIEEISDSDASVLILGESGTGKEMVANSIQKRSARTDKPFIKVNCSIFPETLLASELFGHIRGSFTDARHNRIGRFEAAEGGTLFLDEIAEASHQVQIQLLRVLQDGTYDRIGESITRKSDVRIIAATNKNIEKALQNGEFREDLYYRLNVIPIILPPLRERKLDIPFLIQFFIQKHRNITSKPIISLDNKVMDFLVNYNWPGNVRELENVIAYFFARTKDSIITTDKLPAKLQNPPAFPGQQLASNDSSERQKIKRALTDFQWNKTKAARQLGIGRTTLWRKMKQLGLAEPDIHF